jgi:hypothetical protein
MTLESARAAYVDLVIELDPGWMQPPTAAPSSSATTAAAAAVERKQTWVVFSSMQHTGCGRTRVSLRLLFCPHLYLVAAAMLTAAATRASGSTTPATACQCAASDYPAAALLFLATWIPSVPYSTPELTSTPVMKTNRQCRLPCPASSPVDLMPLQAARGMRQGPLAARAALAVRRCGSQRCRCWWRHCPSRGCSCRQRRRRAVVAQIRRGLCFPALPLQVLSSTSSSQALVPTPLMTMV